jgi:predicted SnoaL-like aldol condensation-catalyzing enzyme
LVGNGVEPFIAYFEKMAKEYPNKSIEFVTMDFFRFDEEGKIVEHSDSMQQIPGSSENGNTMY